MGTSLAPLRHPVFRRLWGANVVSNLGFWMQQVAAGWLMTELTGSPALVALLATAAALPVFLLALPAGALADVVDRRRLIIATQTWQIAVSGTMAVLALTDVMTPGLLLAGTALYGLGSTLGMPPQSAIVPELVPREDLPQAIALNAVAFTVAQALGPAIGGVLVATAGAGWAFAANAVSFLAVVAVVVAWRRETPESHLPPEHVWGAVRAGARYVRHAPPLQLVLARQLLHVFCFAAFPALLAVAVRDDLGAGASGYGLAFGAFGVGGVLGALLVVPRLRARAVPIDAIVAGATVLFAAGALGTVALAPSLPVALPGLVLGGAGSMIVLSSLQAAAQQVLPAWVRGRGLAVSQLVFQAGLAGGAVVWGQLATAQGTPTALVAAAVLVCVLLSGALAAGLRLGSVEGLDLDPAPWPGAHQGASIAPDDGPVLVTIEYRVAEDRAHEFLTEMRRVARLRRRDGAIHWSVASDLDDAMRHVETFVVSSWAEHERQGERRVRADLEQLERVWSLHEGPDRPVVRHLLGHHGRLHLPRAHLARRGALRERARPSAHD
ncbi:MFS transporter [Conexibacter sp. W3-3-2]|uniref:MFS transporter n=1 Tax=Conexibacter sp. W3-3-2 TaxID=2675227 RepID=UPI0012B935E1|nr:MFS transporter [Conexibacter sp. W3-3-2]MTD44712.1 MFS transporter [Conexibacter sp. W3-3-2]